jgi:quercetin dioxygenase-like cupin family protein
VNDNGTYYELGPGDMLQCKDGDFHGIESIGEEELEYLAVIMYSR